MRVLTPAPTNDFPTHGFHTWDQSFFLKARFLFQIPFQFPYFGEVRRRNCIMLENNDICDFKMILDVLGSELVLRHLGLFGRPGEPLGASVGEVPLAAKRASWG